MTIKIGAIIKKLRTENNITQDALATAIGVTPQAISRWEAEGGYPDIELLPAIADFFSVSTDELLGYKKSERECRLADIKKQMSRLEETGRVKERIEFARLALSKYPSDCEIKETLSACLYCLYAETKEAPLLAESENLAIYVVENCKDESIRYDAINTLISIYSLTKNTAKALEMVNLLAPMKYCREFAKSCGIGDGKNEIYKQEGIDKLTDCLGVAIRNLALDDELPNDPSTWDKKIKMLETANNLYFMVYGDNLMFYHGRIAFNYWVISTYQMSLEKIEETLSSLKKMCDHVLAYDLSYKNDHGKCYTSILVDKIVYPESSKDFHELQEHSQCWYMLDRLQNERYDPIRNEKRFIQIEKALKEYAR